MQKHAIHIGTSGWSYKNWSGFFYPQGLAAKNQFSYYVQHFNTVEINNSFYGLPTKETFRKWNETTPDDFVYAIKASRTITHMKRLHDPAGNLELLLGNAVFLGKKLGVILFQLPPSLIVDNELLRDFLIQLPANYRFALEFRNSSWYSPEVYRLLEEYNCAFCIYELENHMSPIVVTADFVYVRLHGREYKYHGNYTEEDLQEWAGLCREWLATKDVFFYFDNTDGEGFAPFNAIRLAELVDQNP